MSIAPTEEDRAIVDELVGEAADDAVDDMTDDAADDAAGEAAARALERAPPTFLVGQRYPHHAAHSGYETFVRHVGSHLRPPVAFRWTQGRIGWPLAKAFAAAVRHPWYSLGAHLGEWSALRHMLGRRRAVYHVLYGDSDLWLLRRANRLTGNFVVASFHQPAAELERIDAIPRVARHLDAVVLVCDAQRPFFEQVLPRERIHVVPHGVDAGWFRPAPRAAHAAAVQAPVCITVGSHLRDFATLREALRLVWREQPAMRFVAIGTRRDPRSWFPPLEDPRIEFLEHVSDEALRRAYRGAHVAMFAFRDATANNAMLEAMACGVPVVATGIGGIPEYAPPTAGLLCPPADAPALASATLRLLGDAALHARLSAGARRQAAALDFGRVAGRMASVYRTVAGAV